MSHLSNIRTLSVHETNNYVVKGEIAIFRGTTSLKFVIQPSHIDSDDVIHIKNHYKIKIS